MDDACDVLVIDDEKVVRDGIRRILQSEDLKVAEAPDAAAGLAHAAVSRCRLVLCDLILPDGSGIDLLRALRKKRPGLAVVLMTGYATEQHAAQAREAGAAEFLPKPFEESELLEMVRRVLPQPGGAAREGLS